MRIFCDVPFHSYGIGRVAFQLAKYLPDCCELASGPESADLIVIHVNGRRDHNMRWMHSFQQKGQQYAVIQYVMDSCRNPDPNDWEELWMGAKCVWSYYDLREFVPDLYYQPLAADPEKFYLETKWDRHFLIGTNGNDFKNECLGEVRMAAYGAGGRVVHTGPLVAQDPIVEHRTNCSDEVMRQTYNECQWFSALRRKDGFEMVAIEALLCGARPILFDTPSYRHWYDGLATFVPETDSETLVNNLRGLLRNAPAPVSPGEIVEAQRRFDWERLIKGFWERCLS